MFKLFLIILYFAGWYALFRWSRIKNRPNIETFAWLMGGISFLMLLFAILNWELVLLDVR
jgi:hypothetical protein